MNVRGFTLVELLIATAVLLTATGAVVSLLHDALARTPAIEEGTDLHQRLRVAVEALRADLRAAGSGTPSGPLALVVASVEPRHAAAPPASTVTDAVTIRYVPYAAARSRLSAPLTPSSDTASLDSNGCPQSTTACGFRSGSRVAVFEPSGQMDIMRVDGIAPNVLTVSSAAVRSATYQPGAEITEIVEVSYALSADTAELRRTEGGGTFAVVDRVESLAFECLAAGLTPVPLPALQDGPFLGEGHWMFDQDLLAIRAVRVTLRLSSPHAAVPDATARFTVALRNGG